MQSSFQSISPPFHVAVNMDGNGRWAIALGEPRSTGHRAGAVAVRRTVEAALDLGISTLTLYAFSSANWKRPRLEVAGIMALVARFLRTQTPHCLRQGVRMSLIGRRDRLPRVVQAAAAAAELATRNGSRLHVRIAVDYSSRHEILRAARALASRPEPTDDDLDRLVRGDVPDVDLLIRTGGERRLSDFLLWECAYAELVFTRTLWPDFRGRDLVAAVEEFRGRDRRFGAVSASAVRSAGAQA